MEQHLSLGRRIVSTATAAVTALALAFPVAAIGPSQAVADDNLVAGKASLTTQSLQLQPQAIVNTNNLVKGAASRAAGPAPEILGITGVEESANDWNADVGRLSWSSPKYYIMGTSEYNKNPNIYFKNAVDNKTNGNTNATPEVVIGNNRGPSSALSEYGTNDNCDRVWAQMPDLIIGTNKDVDYYSTSATAVKAALGYSGNYNPVAINYDLTSYKTLVQTMYTMAEEADKIVSSNSGKTLRYGTALDIAKNYEKYVQGTQGYILKQIADNKTTRKKIASISAANDNGTYTLLADGENGSQKRYIEAVDATTDNIATTLGTTVTSAQLDTADYIIVESMNSSEAIFNKLTAAQQAKTYYVKNGAASGSMYGVVMNSVENAQNIGRILGFIYNDVIDQDDWMCYYYDQFYHIANGKLADAIDNAMDGVRNFDATGSDKLEWTTADAATYSRSAVQAKLDEGMNYLIDGYSTNAGAADSATQNLVPVSTSTDKYNGTNGYVTKNTNISTNVNLSSLSTGENGDLQILQNATIYDELDLTKVDVYANSAKLTLNTDYTIVVKSTNNTKYTPTTATDITSGITVTITGTNKAGTNGITYTGSKDYVIAVNKADFSKAQISGIEKSYDYTGSRLTPAPTVKVGAKTLTATTDYTVKYQQTSGRDASDTTATTVGTVTLTVTPNSNIWSGSAKTQNFTIEFKDATSNTVALTTNPGTGSSATQSVNVKADMSGVTKQVTAGESGYTVSIANVASPSAAAKKVIAGLGSNAKYFVADVKVTSSNNSTTLSENFGSIDLTFNVGSANAGKVAAASEIHTGTGTTTETIDLGTARVASNGDVTFKNITKLSEFVISLADAHTVTFNSLGGSPTYASQSVADGDRATNPGTPTRAGYTFVAWYNKTSKYDFSTPVTSDITLTAYWKKNTVATIQMYRLYSPYTSEHFYTSDTAERDNLVSLGWKFEGIGWNAPKTSNTPVYRLYSKWTGDHHYTTDAAERDNLVNLGWNYEGIGWYSADSTSGLSNWQAHPLYRMYAPFLTIGQHHYTADSSEADFLAQNNWNKEGIGWYAMS